MVLINKLCPVITTSLLFVVISYGTKLDRNDVNGHHSVVEVDSFLHNNDQLPVSVGQRVKRQTDTSPTQETGFKYDGDTISIGKDGEVNVREPKRRAKAAIVNKSGTNDNNTGLTRIRRSKQDLCQHLCTCDTEGTEKFVTVSCSFLMDKVGLNFTFSNFIEHFDIFFGFLKLHLNF